MYINSFPATGKNSIIKRVINGIFSKYPLIAEASALSPKRLKNYNSKEIYTIHKILYRWVSKTPYYKNLIGASVADPEVESSSIYAMFGLPFKYGDNTLKFLDVFSTCYDINFDGERLTEEHLTAFKKIAAGSFDKKDSPYRLKSAQGAILYRAVCSKGIDEGLSLISNLNNSKHPICKTYKLGEESDYVDLIKHYLKDWMSKMPHKGAELDKTNKFDKATIAALELFNQRFGLHCNSNVITERHLEIFTDILCDNLDPEKKPEYEFEDRWQKLVYETICKYGPAKAYKKISLIPGRKKYSLKRAMLASRGRLYPAYTSTYNGNIYNWQIPCSCSMYRGTVTRADICSKIKIKEETADLFSELYSVLNQYGYDLIITSGRRPYDYDSTHCTGRAIDFVVRKNGAYIAKAESKVVAQIIEQFRNQTGRSFTYYNEYIVKFKSTTGDHFHINI
ncbi:MAG: hypothetical protein ABIH00_10800 [Armatimonadota bacterium]